MVRIVRVQDLGFGRDYCDGTDGIAFSDEPYRPRKAQPKPPLPKAAALQPASKLPPVQPAPSMPASPVDGEIAPEVYDE